MAGSYGHVTARINGERQFIGPVLLDHMGDANEALEEMWFLVHYMAGDKSGVIDAALEQFYRPTAPLALRLRERQKNSRREGYWEGRLDDLAEDEPK